MRNKLQETDWFLLYGFAMLWPAKKLLGSIPATKNPFNTIEQLSSGGTSIFPDKKLNCIGIFNSYDFVGP